MPTFGFHEHDHDRCISDALTEAEARCRRDKRQFTPQRRRVLEILLQEHRALGAYDILAILTQDGMGSQPPVVYRALDFLVTAGLAHRIERLNAYIACAHLDSDHAPAFLICRSCRAVAETGTHEASHYLDAVARAEGFRIERVVVEAEGLCPSCQEAS